MGEGEVQHARSILFRMDAMPPHPLRQMGPHIYPRRSSSPVDFALFHTSPTITSEISQFGVRSGARFMEEVRLAGIEQSSATVLKFLRNLFNDQTDELLVIKELLQNADDSGATRVVIGCSDGLPEAAHPLLRGPALFSVNDGPFRPEDARAIVTLGLSTKGGDASTVGKFGLGLKSAFYLAEALFFMDGRLDPAEVWRKPHFDVLSPWVGGDEPYRPDWVKFTSEDRGLILGHLASLGLP